MPEVSLKFDCPNCGCSVKAFIEDEESRLFLFFVCPECKKNVVYYDNKLDIISDKMVMKLFRNDKLKICGELKSSQIKFSDHVINEDDIANLKIMLGTSKDIDDFLEKI